MIQTVIRILYTSIQLVHGYTKAIVVNTYSLSNYYNFVVEHITRAHHLHPNKRKLFQAEQSELFR